MRDQVEQIKLITVQGDILSFCVVRNVYYVKANEEKSA